jgi:hypothetical protein
LIKDVDKSGGDDLKEASDVKVTAFKRAALE